MQNNPRFRFTAKAWQRLTHERKEASRESLAVDCDLVRRSMAPLAEAGMLGALLLQFPWSFRNTEPNLAYLEELIRRLNGMQLAVEVRHGSWDQEAFYAFLREQKVAFCNVDQPVIGDSLGPTARVTARIGYLRLHGRNYRTWFKRTPGGTRATTICTPGRKSRKCRAGSAPSSRRPSETYAVTNNHFRGQALVNAIEILEELDARPPAVPPPLAAAYPQLTVGQRR